MYSTSCKDKIQIYTLYTLIHPDIHLPVRQPAWTPRRRWRSSLPRSWWCRWEGRQSGGTGPFPPTASLSCPLRRRAGSAETKSGVSEIRIIKSKLWGMYTSLVYNTCLVYIFCENCLIRQALAELFPSIILFMIFIHTQIVVMILQKAGRRKIDINQNYSR